MIPALYDHQKRIIDEDESMAVLALGTGSAKTRTALELARGNTLVIVPKQQKLDASWEKNRDTFGIKTPITTISKETFRRDWRIIGQYETVIIDEFHYVLGVLPDTRTRKGQTIPKMSQMFEAVLAYLRQNPPKRLYMLSATPIAKPMNLYALLTLFGRKVDFFKFRARFYFEKKIGYRSLWMPRKDKASKELLITLLKTKVKTYTGQLSDYFDVPEQTHKTIYVELTQEQNRAIQELALEEADPMVSRALQRTIENGIRYRVGADTQEVGGKECRIVKQTETYRSHKIEKIKEFCEEFPKVLIFAAYTGQIAEIKRHLEDEHQTVYTLTGQTKNRENVIKEAEASEACIVIAQSSISSGYELPSFPCVIFASKSYLFRDYEQGLGRVLRANKLKKNLYVHLVVEGGVDQDCHDSIISGADFQEKLLEQ